MITLSTGTPGAGKTLNTIKLVDQECQGRKIYYRGIRDLTLDWEEISNDDCLHWQKYPDGSVFVIDEVQQVWPNVPSNKPSPLSVTDLDTHRHRGFDFYIITQKPTMVDFRVRGFVGRHYHYERAFGWNGTRQLEFQKAVSDPDDYHTREESQKKRLKFDKKYFGVYKSAEVHTGKPRIPKVLYYFAAALIATFAFGVYAYNSIQDRQELPEYNQPGQSDNSPFGPNSNFLNDDRPMNPDEYIASYQPRVSDLPFSAPAYDEVTEVKTYPRPQCLYRPSKDICKCYTQQATPLSVSYTQCRNIVANGWFNPFRDESEEEGGGQALAPPPSAQSATFSSVGKTAISNPDMARRMHPDTRPQTNYLPKTTPPPATLEPHKAFNKHFSWER